MNAHLHVALDKQIRGLEKDKLVRVLGILHERQERDLKRMANEPAIHTIKGIIAGQIDDCHLRAYRNGWALQGRWAEVLFGSRRRALLNGTGIKIAAVLNQFERDTLTGMLGRVYPHTVELDMPLPVSEQTHRSISATANVRDGEYLAYVVRFGLFDGTMPVPECTGGVIRRLHDRTQVNQFSIPDGVILRSDRELSVDGLPEVTIVERFAPGVYRLQIRDRGPKPKLDVEVKFSGLMTMLPPVEQIVDSSP